MSSRARFSGGWPPLWTSHWLLILLMPLTSLFANIGVEAVHHMKRAPLQYVNRRDETRSLRITNTCPETIYPGIVTQSGSRPSKGGFKLDSGDSQTLAVSADWQGRVWGRTNCTFNRDGTGTANKGGGRACGSGDCGSIVDCKATGEVPVTLAEFTLASSSGQTFYDISLVDGYNIPMAILSLHAETDQANLTEIPPNLTNPVCIGTAGLLASQGSTDDSLLGTNSSFLLPLDQSVSEEDVATWCPWDLQLQPPTGPANGVYSYPDTTIQRPQFNPCYSACARYNKPEDCCTGAYGSPRTCKPSQYSQEAKKVCPDAYSFAYDDQDSTFIIPSGGGFEVIFCPAGRSTTILNAKADELRELHEYGYVTQSPLAQRGEFVFSRRTNDGVQRRTESLWGFVTVLVFAVCGGL